LSIALAGSDTSDRILKIAEHLVQTRGFNAFSYADIAAELNLTKASLHYHFPSKAKLGERLVERYQSDFLAALVHIDKSCNGSGAKLNAYVGIYADVLENGRMCLCGMLAADYVTLPETIKDRLRSFFEANEAWLTGVLQQGRANKQLTFAGPPIEWARFVVGALEGAMLLARSHDDPRRFRSAAERLLSGFLLGKRKAT
jgi:TetR/AcrR family transcriptional regulator, transcriptional repressor for nem operon